MQFRFVFLRIAQSFLSGFLLVALVLLTTSQGCSEPIASPAARVSSGRGVSPPPPPPEAEKAAADDTPPAIESEVVVDEAVPTPESEDLTNAQEVDSSPAQLTLPVRDGEFPPRFWRTSGGSFEGRLDRINSEMGVVIVVDGMERVVPFNELAAEDRRTALDTIAYAEFFRSSPATEGEK